MNETPTVAPMTTDSTVTPAQAPLSDVPAPLTAPTDDTATVASDSTPVRGRVASPRTVAIRSMLEDTDGEITYSTALPLLQKLGFDVDQNTFNVTKSAWKRARRPDAPKANTAPKSKPKARKVEKVEKAKRVLPDVSVGDAIAFVTEAGGLAKAEATVLRALACLKAFKSLVKQTAKLAA